MFDLEQAIKQWRKSLRKYQSLEDGYIEELESHLRDEIDKGAGEGLSEEKAFEEAVAKIGNVESIGAEYYKTHTTKISARPPWETHPWMPALLANYFKVAVRSIKRHKGYSFINISGLTIGIACCMLIFLYVQDELSWDRFHENSDNIYRVISDQQTKDQIIHNARTPDPLAPILKEKYPEIVDAIRFQGFDGWPVRCGGKTFVNPTLGTADPSFFEMFTFPFLKGDPKTALNDRYSVVITEETALKYFGNEDPMGKIINISENFKVTGVIKNLPHNSHLHFDCMFPIINMELFWEEDFEDWDRIAFYTYVQLQDNCSVEDLGPKIAGVVREHHPESNIIKTYLQPLDNVHLRSFYQWDLDNYKQGNINYVYVLSIIALCILAIACINFMNLSTARSGGRAKEVGLRKVAGAQRRDIINQFFGESILMSFVSLLFAVILIRLFLPVFNDLSGKQLGLDLAGNIHFIVALLAVTCLTGVAAGSYPAIYLSSFRPAIVLKGLLPRRAKHRSNLRSVLVITQFALTIVLLIGTTLIYNQLDYIRNRELGFDKDHIIYFSAGPFDGNYETVKNILLQNSNILRVTFSKPPNGKPWGESAFDWEGKNPDENIIMYTNRIDYDYVKTFNIKMADGRFFSKSFATDDLNYVVNEAAVKTMGIVEPVGKRFSHAGREGKIIGVIKDFHQSSLHNEIEPLILEMSGEWHTACAKIAPEDVSETIGFIENVWGRFAGGNYPYPFSYEFLDEAIDDFYKTERKIGLIFRYFTILVIFISCLGLFGLASFIAEQRTKEIGIRKVLGASITEILLLLTKEFTKCVILANIIAWPVAYLAANHWLKNFSYRIDIGLDAFIISALLSLTIALLTVSYQAIRAATANPVDTLRYE